MSTIPAGSSPRHRASAPEHPQVPLVHPYSGETIDVDKGIAPLIAALWRAGGTTFYSCQADEAWVPLSDQRMREGVEGDRDNPLIGRDATGAPVARVPHAYIVGDLAMVAALVNAVRADATEVAGDPDDVPIAIIVRAAHVPLLFLVHLPCWAIPVLATFVGDTRPTGRQPNRAERRREARRKGRGR